MGAWLAKIFGRVGGNRPASGGAVREALQAALRNRCKVFLEVPDQRVVANTQVQQITNGEIIIAQPAIGGMTYPLAFGETLRLSFVDQKSSITGRTRCLGRVKIAGEGGRTVFAYRLALPESLKIEERRVPPPSADVLPAAAPEAQLYRGTMPRPLTGRLTSISMTGARLHTSMPVTGFSIGEEVYLKVALPEPAGLMDELVQVQRMEGEAGTGMTVVSVVFRRRLPRLEALIRVSPDRLVMPQASASAPPQPQRKTA
jgi:hypothetical protein